jgi:hypothetical protein
MKRRVVLAAFVVATGACAHQPQGALETQTMLRDACALNWPRNTLNQNPGALYDVRLTLALEDGRNTGFGTRLGEGDRFTIGGAGPQANGDCYGTVGVFDLSEPGKLRYRIEVAERPNGKLVTFSADDVVPLAPSARIDKQVEGHPYTIEIRRAK